MKYPRAVLLVVAAPAALFLACSSGAVNSSSTGSAASSGVGGGSADCPVCVGDADCAAGSKCAQFGGDAYCAPDCSASPTCAGGRACTPLSGTDGTQVNVCVPITNVCGGSMSGTGGAPATSSAASSSSGGSETCGSLDGPDVTAACTACKTSNMPCQANGCYGGWWCNVDSKGCQAPPSPSSCGTTSSASSTASSSSTTSSSSSGGTGGTVGPTGGTLDTLSFAIVGDTRPPTEDDTAHYPKAIIQKIWQDIEAATPRPAFAVTTGDYMFAKAYGSQSGPQLDLYLAARAAFTNVVFPAMGNHECTGATVSECGQGNPDGVTVNYNNFLTKMLAPIGQSLPYYTINVSGTNNAWTSKFVFIACNAWTSTQATWLGAQLAKPTTYTFVVRHEGSIANTVPCVTPSAAIMAQHPYTLLIAGHTHTYAYYASEKQIIVGNGGAPLSGSTNYGYVIATQQANGKMLFKEFDYSTNALNQMFTVSP